MVLEGGYHQADLNSEDLVDFVISITEEISFVEHVRRTTLSLSIPIIYIGCVRCEDYEYGWLKFVAAAFVPLTAFYILVIIFRISVTLSSLNGFVLVSQIMVTPPIIRKIYSYNQVNSYFYVSNLTRLCIDTGIAIYAIWSLDFFRSFYKPICVSPDLKYQHVLLLDYAVAVYPLFLIFITFICVKLHDNFSIVVWFWRPFHKIMLSSIQEAMEHSKLPSQCPSYLHCPLLCQDSQHFFSIFDIFKCV